MGQSKLHGREGGKVQLLVKGPTNASVPQSCGAFAAVYPRGNPPVEVLPGRTWDPTAASRARFLFSSCISHR